MPLLAALDFLSKRIPVCEQVFKFLKASLPIVVPHRREDLIIKAHDSKIFATDFIARFSKNTASEMHEYLVS